jgi:hypothetical protein
VRPSGRDWRLLASGHSESRHFIIMKHMVELRETRNGGARGIRGRSQRAAVIGSCMNDGFGIWLRFNPVSDVSSDNPSPNTCRIF